VGVLLSGCGSGASSSKATKINAELRRAQTEIEAHRGELRRKLEREAGRVDPAFLHGHRGKLDTLGSIGLYYIGVPKGINAAEWNAAVRKDRALQRALKAE
jgi:hypothetical protein